MPGVNENIRNMVFRNAELSLYVEEGRGENERLLERVSYLKRVRGIKSRGKGWDTLEDSFFFSVLQPRVPKKKKRDWSYTGRPEGRTETFECRVPKSFFFEYREIVDEN